MIEEIVKADNAPKHAPHGFVMPRIRGGIHGFYDIGGFFRPRRGFFSLVADAASAFWVRRAA